MFARSLSLPVSSPVLHLAWHEHMRMSVAVTCPEYGDMVCCQMEKFGTDVFRGLIFYFTEGLIAVCQTRGWGEGGYQRGLHCHIPPSFPLQINND